MPRRRQRARGDRRAAGEGADVLMDSVKNPDYVERLAHKYMRKCKVESSTESESDNYESFGNRVSTIETSERMDFLKLQFLDPYDGDSEETEQFESSAQDQILSDDDQTLDPPSASDSHMSMDCSSVSIPEQQTPCDGWNLSSCEAKDVCMVSRPNLDSTNTVKRSWQRMVSPTRSSELSMDSGVATEEPTIKSGHFLLTGVDSRASNPTLSVFPTSMTSEENSDFSLLESSLAKRKFGLKMEYEKLRRKKARVLELIN
ncbi:uncharacterized protein LOC142108715 [Mixophyes fleayi]|uniref:uncharacterized protein LOC142108715 n=1 Tax=Mixophyes fleayi TaxID=3061075 RepID=UPI003F4D9D49